MNTELLRTLQNHLFTFFDFYLCTKDIQNKCIGFSHSDSKNKVWVQKNKMYDVYKNEWSKDKDYLSRLAFKIHLEHFAKIKRWEIEFAKKKISNYNSCGLVVEHFNIIK